ncbi:hypothetical protein GE09DRAFT_267108 [Coniochaeta sp. 2T2.1]|nr:hypothetical protein GE09DRAFT_267108 [Coniochaeta sp. 2T2.1]
MSLQVPVPVPVAAVPSTPVVVTMPSQLTLRPERRSTTQKPGHRLCLDQLNSPCPLLSLQDLGVSAINDSQQRDHRLLSRHDKLTSLFASVMPPKETSNNRRKDTNRQPTSHTPPTTIASFFSLLASQLFGRVRSLPALPASQSISQEHGFCAKGGLGSSGSEAAVALGIPLIRWVGSMVIGWSVPIPCHVPRLSGAGAVRGRWVMTLKLAG